MRHHLFDVLYQTSVPSCRSERLILHPFENNSV
jgi:hypothetical protein